MCLSRPLSGKLLVADGSEHRNPSAGEDGEQGTGKLSAQPAITPHPSSRREFEDKGLERLPEPEEVGGFSWKEEECVLCCAQLLQFQLPRSLNQHILVCYTE